MVKYVVMVSGSQTQMMALSLAISSVVFSVANLRAQEKSLSYSYPIKVKQESGHTD